MNSKIRHSIYINIDGDNTNSRSGAFYNIFMMLTIAVSMIPLVFKSTTRVLNIIDLVSMMIFIIDYILRWITADFELNKGRQSFIKYPFTFMAVIDLLSILPSVTMLNSGLRVLKIFRMLRALRVLRVFKAFRYSKNINIITDVFKKQKDSLTVVGTLALGYVLVSALIIFNVEPDTFDNFFDAVYWATVSLTTVGYGDIFATSVTGKIITMLSAFFGIAVVALPAGIITAGYMDEISQEKEKEEDKTE